MSVSNFLSGGSIDLTITEALADRLEEAIGVYPAKNPESENSENPEEEEG